MNKSAVGIFLAELEKFLEGLNEIEQKSQEGTFILPDNIFFRLKGGIEETTAMGGEAGIEKVVVLSLNYNRDSSSSTEMEVSGEFKRASNG